MFLTDIRADGIDDRSPWGDFWFEPVSMRTSAGMRVSSDSALKLSAVFRSVCLLAETRASLPFQLYRPKKSGGIDLVTDHWLYDLIACQPNAWQNGFEWSEMMQGHMVLRGTCYNEIVPDNRGGIKQLVPLHPDRVKLEVLSTGKYRYRVRQNDGTDQILAPSEIFKIAGLSSNGLTGISVLECARESIGAGLAQQDFAARFFANDARPLGGWIENPTSFKDKPARDAWRASWQEAQSGANRGKTAVLENGMKYHELGLNNKDSQFIEAAAAKVTDIARWFGVPPHMIADLSKSTNNNIEQQSLEFVMYTMGPWAKRWKAAIEGQLLGDDEDLKVEFDFDDLLRADQVSRGEFYTSGINAGWMTRNEVRLKEHLNPLPGLDVPLQPLNMQPAGAKPKPAPGGTVPDDEHQNPPPDEDDKARRLEALTVSVASRIVRKEVVVLRKAFERAQKESLETRRGGFIAFAESFYREHVEHVATSLQCPIEIADAWCARQQAELMSELDVGALGMETIPALLETWESSAAAELANRVQIKGESRS